MQSKLKESELREGKAETKNVKYIIGVERKSHVRCMPCTF